MKKQERIKALLRNLASSFTRKEIDSGPGVILTVMRVETSGDLRWVKIFVSVFPENKEREISQLLKSKSRQFHDSLKHQLRTKFLPLISFEIDRAIKLEREIEGLVAK